MSDKHPPDPLILRATPPYRVVRFRKGLIIGLSATGLCFIMAVTMLALRSPQKTATEHVHELYHTERKQTPEGLNALPDDYTQIPEKKPEKPENEEPIVPILGPPLPGDLGRPILEHQKSLGVTSVAGLTAFEQGQEERAARARESGVFFRVQSTSKPAGQGAVPLATNDTQTPETSLALDPERDQNNQQRKLDFVAQRKPESIYTQHAVQEPVSPYQIMAGTILSASLITGINSDLPGLVIAQVTENIYDTVTGQFLLIPQGSRLIGSYDSVVAYGQSRALLVWQRIVMPNGSSIQIDNLPATDASGSAGLEDRVDYHTATLLKGIVLSSLLDVGTELSVGSSESELVQAVRQSTQQNVAQSGQQLTSKNLNIQPTITIRPGWPVHIIVHKDIILKPYQGG